MGCAETLSELLIVLVHRAIAFQWEFGRAKTYTRNVRASPAKPEDNLTITARFPMPPPGRAGPRGECHTTVKNLHLYELAPGKMVVRAQKRKVGA